MTVLEHQPARQALMHDEGLCTRRAPVLLMPPSMVESLRAVEMKTLALSQDEVQLMNGPHQLDLNF